MVDDVVPCWCLVTRTRCNKPEPRQVVEGLVRPFSLISGRGVKGCAEEASVERGIRRVSRQGCEPCSVRSNLHRGGVEERW